MVGGGLQDPTRGGAEGVDLGPAAGEGGHHRPRHQAEAVFVQGDHPDPLRLAPDDLPQAHDPPGAPVHHLGPRGQALVEAVVGEGLQHVKEAVGLLLGHAPLLGPPDEALPVGLHLLHFLLAHGVVDHQVPGHEVGKGGHPEIVSAGLAYGLYRHNGIPENLTFCKGLEAWIGEGLTQKKQAVAGKVAPGRF